MIIPLGRLPFIFGMTLLRVTNWGDRTKVLTDSARISADDHPSGEAERVESHDAMIFGQAVGEN